MAQPRRVNRMPPTGGNGRRPSEDGESPARKEIRRQLQEAIDFAVDEEGFRGAAFVCEFLAARLTRANAEVYDYMPDEGPPSEVEDFREVLEGIIADTKQTEENLVAFTEALNELFDDDWEGPE